MVAAVNGGEGQAARILIGVDQELRQDERNRQMLSLRLAAPKRGNAGKPLAAQEGVGDCPLFGAVDQGRLL